VVAANLVEASILVRCLRAAGWTVSTIEGSSMIVAIASAVSTIEGSSSAAPIYRGVGAGDGVGPGDINMDITATATHMATGMVTRMGTILVIKVAITAARVTDPITPPIHGLPSCSADLHKLAITTERSTESWGVERNRQFERTSATTDTRADPRSADFFRQLSSFNLACCSQPAVPC